jgi:hypothetical protein
MSRPVNVELGDTRRCTRAGQCEICQGTTSLLVVARDSMLGELCATVCANCLRGLSEGKQRFPNLGCTTAALRVGDHCEHLGIDLDQMADLVAAERGEG